MNLFPTAGIITRVAMNAMIANPKDACNVPIESGTRSGRNINIPARGTRANTGNNGMGRGCKAITNKTRDDVVERFKGAFL